MVKRLIGIALLLLVLGAALYAEESRMFVVTKPITKIYTHRLGFKVVFLKNDLTLGEFYVPMQWFDEPGGKGLIIKGEDNAYPYFSIFWYEGKFHSIRLYAKKNVSHETWGSLENRQGIEANFEVDAISLDL